MFIGLPAKALGNTGNSLPVGLVRWYELEFGIRTLGRFVCPGASLTSVSLIPFDAIEHAQVFATRRPCTYNYKWLNMNPDNAMTGASYGGLMYF